MAGTIPCESCGQEYVNRFLAGQCCDDGPDDEPELENTSENDFDNPDSFLYS